MPESMPPAIQMTGLDMLSSVNQVELIFVDLESLMNSIPCTFATDSILCSMFWKSQKHSLMKLLLTSFIRAVMDAAMELCTPGCPCKANVSNVMFSDL
jgi:hypothetical protein